MAKKIHKIFLSKKTKKFVEIWPGSGSVKIILGPIRIWKKHFPDPQPCFKVLISAAVVAVLKQKNEYVDLVVNIVIHFSDYFDH